MTVKVSTPGNKIILDGEEINLCVVQNNGTRVYTPENRITGQKYQEHKMPHERYSLSHAHPASGNAGSVQFEKDIRALLETLKA